MNEIVHAHLPGVRLVHLPTPPPQIRAITDHVYFYLDRTSPLWPEFSVASAIGMHFAGDWPELADGALGGQGRPAMTDNDDPFGRRDRTIIRPNPGGRRPRRRPAARRPPRRRRAAGFAARRRRSPYPAASVPAAALSPPPRRASRPPRRGRQGNWDGWMTTPTPPPVNPYMQQPARSAPMTPAPVSPHMSVDLVSDRRQSADARGRFAAAAARPPAGFAVARRRRPADGPGRPGDRSNSRSMRAPPACRPNRSTPPNMRSPPPPTTSCRTLPTEDRQVWTQYSMLVRFFSERTGGVRFFQELDRAKQNPAVNLGLLEIMHACLSLGFEGVYRARRAARARCRASAATSMRRSAARSPRRSRICRRIGAARTSRSPAADSASRSGRSRRSAGVILLGVYLVLRNMLSGQAEALALQDGPAPSRHRNRPSRARPSVKPPPDPRPATSTQLRAHPRRAGRRDSRRQGRAPTQTATTIFIRIGNVVLFPSGGGEGQRLPSLRSPRRSPPRSTRSRARSASTAIPTPTRSGPLPFPRISSFRRRAPNRSRRCSKPDSRNPERLTVAGQGRGQSGRAERHRTRTNRRTGAWKFRFRAPTDQDLRAEVSLSS